MNMADCDHFDPFAHYGYRERERLPQRLLAQAFKFTENAVHD